VSDAFDLVLQLALATVFGGAIGLERELKGKPAGLRTNILICIGAASFTHLSLQIGSGVGDPGRVAAQILTGVGFIGAGTILHTRGSVTGLTSAATIWVVTAIGMDLGTGLYVQALATTAMVMVVLAGLGRAEKVLADRATHAVLVVHARREPDPVEELRRIAAGLGLAVAACRIERETEGLAVELELRGPRPRHDEALAAALRLAGVRSASLSEPSA
jgi:putative Mg2+ transporter-C (MgtC) family protein